MKRTLLFLIFIGVFCCGGLSDRLQTSTVYAHSLDLLSPKQFPRSKIIDVQVYFWKKVFTEVATTEAVLHDRDLILPIYEKVSLKGLNRKQAKRKIKVRKYHVQKQLKALAHRIKTNQPLSHSQKKLLNKFYKGITPKQLIRAANRIRLQYGVADRFREGIVRSGAYMPYIKKVLARYKVPLELAYLPHVESSFHYISHSKSGAKGIWQFTRTTGKQYMRVNSRVDERIDPFISTIAAAKLLRSNYDMLGAWPLAITAYNHGPNGIRKISKKLQTKDMGYIIRHYHSPSFNFASKNFYAEFLAASEVAANYEKYFGPLQLRPPLRFNEARIPKSMSLTSIASRLGYSKKQLVALNPALKPAVVRGKYYVPSYYRIKIPLSKENVVQTKKIQKNKQQSSRSKKKTGSAAPRWITVKSGDTLSQIANRFNMTARKLSSINNISLHKTLYPGQVLRVSSLQSSYVVVRSGDSLTSIARRYGVAVRELAVINDLSLSGLIHPGQKLKLPETIIRSSSTKSLNDYIVQGGDTLFSIARRNSISVNRLIVINGLSENSVIYPGQKLTVTL
ncbi:MAG: LysM peptidoglycan-binding domain-containing protein [SAR324 cluster bacterium]|nr:LysM peptidoglycan-binding domain-containing protein [SAR324 cluster bacterium]